MLDLGFPRCDLLFQVLEVVLEQVCQLVIRTDVDFAQAY